MGQEGAAPKPSGEIVLGELIAKGAHSLVHAATCGDHEVVVKFALNSDARGALLLRREAAAIARIGYEGVVRVLEVGRWQDGRNYLVTERVEGLSLAELLRKGVRSEPWVVEFACTLALTLHHVHGRGLVHRDLKPANILLPADDSAAPKLIDFGLAVEGNISDRPSIGGSFKYSAPEQTGALHRSVDGRADLYALGVVLFECLVGRPPFEADDVAQLIRMHVQQQPPDVCALRPDVTPALGQIIAKLLAKDPDDRFADAAKLHRELVRLSAELDQPSLPPLTQREPLLIGRAAELSMLRPLLVRAASGHGSSALVRGPRGSGRSRLLRRVAELARQGGQSAWFATSDSALPVPFGVFVRLVDSLLEERGRVDGPERDHAVSTAASGFEPFLLRVFPVLSRHLAGGGAPVEAGQERYYEAVSGFLLRLLDQLGGGVLVVDDVHRLDDESREVLTRLCRDCQPYRILVLGSEDAATAEQTSMRIDSEVMLSPLDATAIYELLKRELGSLEPPLSLARALHLRSLGNPLAVLEGLRATLNAGLLTPHWGVWQLDESGLHHLSLPTGLADLIVRKLDELDERTRTVLRFSAVCDGAFDLDTLVALVAGALSKPELRAALDTSVHAGLLTAEQDRYRFVHLELTERLVGELGDAEQRSLYARLATYEDAAGADDDASLYARAYHHQLGLSSETAKAAISAVRAAGERALLRRAPVRAYALLSVARQIAEEHGLDDDYSLYAKLAESRRESGDVVDALVYLHQAIQRCKDPIERASLHLLACEINAFVLTDTSAVAEEAAAIYELTGMRRPTNDLRAALATLWWLFLTVIFESLRIKIRNKNPAKTTVLLHVCEPTAVQALYDSEFVHLLYITARPAYLSMKLGPCTDLSHHFATRAVAMAILRIPARDYYLNKAISMGEALGDNQSVALALARGGIACLFSGDYRNADSYMERALTKHAGYLKLTDLMLATTEHANQLSLRGYNERSRTLMEHRIQEMSMPSPRDKRWENLRSPLMVCYARLGRVAEAAQAIADHHKDATSPSDGHAWLMRWGTQVRLRVETNDFSGSELDAAIDNIGQVRLKLAYLPWQLIESYVDVAWARYGQLRIASLEQRKVRLEQLRAAVSMLSQAPPHPLWKVHRKLLSAVLLTYDGHPEKALARLAEAELDSERLDIPIGVFHARLLSARFLASTGQPETARRHAIFAHALALEMSWPARASVVAHEFSLAERASVSRELAPSSPRLSRGSSNKPVSARQIDGATALLQVSLAVAASREPEAQARAALDALLEILMGERGFLFLVDATGERLERVAARDHNKRDLGDDVPMARSLVERVWKQGQPLVMAGTEEGKALGSESVVAQELRSMICAPLMLQGTTMGVVYLDSRLAKGIFTVEDIDILVAIATQIAIARETASQAERDIARRELERDLQLTAAVQRLLLPKEDASDSGPLPWAAHYDPVAKTSGDFWFKHTLPSGGLRFMLGDVTGHGTGPAMVTAIVAGCVRTLVDESHTGTEELLRRMNTVVRNICRGEFMTTLTVLELEPSGEARFWNCAAPPLVHLTATGNVATYGGPGSPIGSEQLQFSSGSLNVAPDDLLLLASDGVFELSAPNGRAFGLRRVARALETCRGLTPKAARAQLLAAFSEQSGGARDDDLTFMVAGRQSRSGF